MTNEEIIKANLSITDSLKALFHLNDIYLLLDAAREDEAIRFSRFLYYGTWQTIGDDGQDMLYKSYKTGEEKFASELYKIYKNDTGNRTAD